jgi:hypothetical protein
MELNENKQMKLQDLNELKDRDIDSLKYKMKQLEEKSTKLSKQMKDEQDEVSVAGLFSLKKKT